MNIVYIGSAPAEEDCAQTGSKHYDWPRLQRIECRAYIQALKRVYGEPPDGARLSIVNCPHDFGSYCEVQCRYHDDTPAAIAYAIKVESGLSRWKQARMWAPVRYADNMPVHVLPEEQWLTGPLDANKVPIYQPDPDM